MSVRLPVWTLALLATGFGTRVVRAQTTSPEDATIDTIRRLSTVSPLDQDSIRQWMQIQIDRLAAAEPKVGGLNGEAFKTFRTRFSNQYANSANTEEFRAQFAAQTAAVAATEFAKKDLKPVVGWGLAYVLKDMPRQPETISGLLAGVGSAVPVVRYLCADGLAAQRSAIAADADRLRSLVAALRSAGPRETSPPVRGRMYEALAFPGQLTAVFDVYLAIFDSRLEQRRTGQSQVYGAEIAAFEFFRSDPVRAALDAGQKTELVRRLAVFLRLDAERYSDPTIAPPTSATAPDLSAREREIIERRIDAEEHLLALMVGDGGGKIRETFAKGGYDLRSEVLRQAYAWIGNAQTDQRGPLNDPPWSVAVGAP